MYKLQYINMKKFLFHLSDILNNCSASQLVQQNP